MDVENDGEADAANIGIHSKQRSTIATAIATYLDIVWRCIMMLHSLPLYSSVSALHELHRLSAIFADLPPPTCPQKDMQQVAIGTDLVSPRVKLVWQRVLMS